jgi:ATP-dependent exoDNAse (exonuclease V) beta subunit
MLADGRLEWTSPSQLEGGARVHVARMLDLGGSIATTRGTLMHALFEQITWLDDGTPDAQQLWRVAERLASLGLDVEQELAAFDNMLAMPEVRAVLHRSFYESPSDAALERALTAAGAGRRLRAVAHNERRFAVREERRLLSGTTDRLVLLYDDQRLVAADIVDYKTDAIASNDRVRLEQLVDHYRPQLQAYCGAVSTLYRLPLSQICARLLFLSPGTMRLIEGAQSLRS